MKRSTLVKQIILIGIVVVTTSSLSFGQLFKTPIVTDVGEYNAPSFVLVIKANEKFNKPERVVMEDFTPSAEAFDPEKIHTYPRWKFSNMNILNNDGTSTRHLILKCLKTNKYFTYPSGKGVQMVDESVYEKAMNKEDRSYDDIKPFIYFPVVEGDYIKLGIPNNEGKNLRVTPPNWNTREFKLVLVE